MYGLGQDTHPLHIHVTHFQIVSFEATAGATQDTGSFFQIGDWRDTIPALDGMMTIRFKAAAFPGETMLHCHFLRHEDLGMMSSFYVCDPDVAGHCPAALDNTVVKSSTATSSSTGTSTGTSSSSSTAGFNAAQAKAAPLAMLAALVAAVLAFATAM